MLELEVARLTKSEKKLRSEVERLCNVEESLEKLRIEFRQLDLRNWMWLKPILGEFLGCTFCTEIYIKVVTTLLIYYITFIFTVH
jgi:hypothetical protein